MELTKEFLLARLKELEENKTFHLHSMLRFEGGIFVAKMLLEALEKPEKEEQNDEH